MFRKLSKRWAVKLSSPDQLGRIPSEQVELSTRLSGEDGSELLMFRDNFTAYKAANYARASVFAGYVAADGHDYPSSIRLESGELLRLGIPLDITTPPLGGML